MNDDKRSPTGDIPAAILTAVSAAARLLQEARAVDSFGPHYYDDALDIGHLARLLGELLGVDLSDQGEALREWLEENPNRSEVRLVAWALSAGERPAPIDFETVFKSNLERVRHVVKHSQVAS